MSRNLVKQQLEALTRDIERERTGKGHERRKRKPTELERVQREIRQRDETDLTEENLAAIAPKRRKGDDDDAAADKAPETNREKKKAMWKKKNVALVGFGDRKLGKYLESAKKIKSKVDRDAGKKKRERAEMRRKCSVMAVGETPESQGSAIIAARRTPKDNPRKRR